MLIELCETNAEFLLVGGWAVILYGHVRATDDMAGPSTMNSERVFAALEAFGAPLQSSRGGARTLRLAMVMSRCLSKGR